MLGACGVGIMACVLGLAAAQSAPVAENVGQQLLDLLRVASTAVLAVTLLLGPGIALRTRPTVPRLGLGFLPIPGLALLAVTGGLAWALADAVSPRTFCSIVLIAALLCVLLSVLRAGPGEILDREERRVLLVAGCVLGLAIARTLWSLGPSGELYAGTVSRTLEVGDRSDSRISFHVVQLVAHGTAPYSERGAAYFAPYTFSDRGPLPGLAAAPIVLASGGRPPIGFPDQAWAPFDPQGFMAYRLAMMAFAATAFLSLWTLTRRLAGGRAAYLALLLAATTPFLVHEVWFTWPKLLAASLVLLAATCVIAERPLLGGCLAGVGYLAHPMALLSLPALGLLALWPLLGAHLRKPRIRHALLLAAGVAISLVAWRIANGSHYTQGEFVDYLTAADGQTHASLSAWLSSRLESLGNTLVPLYLFLFSGSDPRLNAVGGTSPGVIHFFFQYWNSLPFAVGILFFPMLLLSLWRAARRWPWAIVVGVLVPFVAFAVYWGSSNTGLPREGLQTWVLTLFAVVAVEQGHRHFAWLRSLPARTILALRSVEVLAVAMVPTLATRHRVVAGHFALTDVVAIVGMVALSAVLAALVWCAPMRTGDSAPPRLD